MRICDGVGSYLQLCGLLAKLALVRGDCQSSARHRQEGLESAMFLNGKTLVWKNFILVYVK